MADVLDSGYASQLPLEKPRFINGLLGSANVTCYHFRRESMAIPNLLFVDANIWLDSYRVRNDTGLRLLDHTEALADRLIVTYQLESEYKRNRQAALFEGMQELKACAGKVFRRVLKGGARQEAGVTANVVWYAVKRCAEQAGIDNLAPHDLRGSCARLSHGCGGELEQIQFLLGHASVQTTERYIGCKQKLQDAVNDRLGISVARENA